MADVAALAELEMSGGVPDDQTAKSLIGDQHVGAKPKHEIRNAMLSGGLYGLREVIGSLSFKVQIRRPTNLEGGIWSEWLIESDALTVQFGGEGFQLTGIEW